MCLLQLRCLSLACFLSCLAKLLIVQYILISEPFWTLFTKQKEVIDEAPMCQEVIHTWSLNHISECLWISNLQLSSSPFPKSSSSSSSSSGSRCPWQGLVGVIWLGPSRLVPSCNFLMCRTTAVALNACCVDRKRNGTENNRYWERRRAKMCDVCLH